MGVVEGCQVRWSPECSVSGVTRPRKMRHTIIAHDASLVNGKASQVFVMRVNHALGAACYIYTHEVSVKRCRCARGLKKFDTVL